MGYGTLYTSGRIRKNINPESHFVSALENGTGTKSSFWGPPEEFVYERAIHGDDGQSILIPSPAAQTLRRGLLGVSSTRARVRPVSHATTV